MSSNGSLATIGKFTPGSLFVESFNLLGTGVVLSNGPSGGPRLVSLTTLLAGGGTTTMAINLALTLAGTQRRTLLVDANFRTPMLHDALGVSQTPGLADWLMKKTTLEEAIKATKTPHLDILPAGTISAATSAVLQGSALAPSFEQLRARYEAIVVDTAPALRFPDALHIARATEGTIVVLPVGGAPRRAVYELRRRLERVGGKILGVVLNRLDPRELSSR